MIKLKTHCLVKRDSKTNSARRMNGPFSDYAWGFAYEGMHETMYRMKDKDPSPPTARDDQLAAMWSTAYDAYQTTLRVFELNSSTVSRLQERLIEAREAENQAAEAEVLERLAAVEMTSEVAASVEARLQRQVEWLDEIDAEYDRRSWLNRDDTCTDPWAINQETVGWSEAL